jgi:hypothetical protein
VAAGREHGVDAGAVAEAARQHVGATRGTRSMPSGTSRPGATSASGAPSGMTSTSWFATTRIAAIGPARPGGRAGWSCGRK